MNRRRTVLSILIILMVILTSCGGSNHESAPDALEPKGDPYQAPAIEEFPPAPPTTPSTTTIVPEIPDEDLEVKTFNVSPWGEKVYNQEHTLSLQAKQHEFGDNASVSSYKLCAEGVDVPMADTGYGNSPVQVIGLPKIGEVLTVKQQAYPPKHFITIDDSKVTLVADNGAQTLDRVLLNGTCTDVNVEMLTGDDRNAVVGFSYTTIPFGEWRPDGGFTWTNPVVSEEAGNDVTTISYEWFVN